MEKIQKKYLIYLIVGVIILIFLLVIGYWLMVRKEQNKNTSQINVEPTEAIIPTVDSTVKIDLLAMPSGKEVVLKINRIPNGTESIDYELSYQTKEQGLQGVIGAIAIKGDKDYQKKLTLGTCSSGTCVYHQVIGKIRLNLKFNGDYGEKIFEKEYRI